MLTPRPTLNDEWIESQEHKVQEYASEEFYGMKDPSWWAGFLDNDEREQFKEIYDNRTPQMCRDYEVRHEYEDVFSRAESALRYQLEEKKLYNKIPTEDEIEEVNDAFYQAGHDLAYTYAESWHYFFVLNGLMPLTRNIEVLFGKTREELTEIYEENRGEIYVQYRSNQQAQRSHLIQAALTGVSPVPTRR